MTVGESETKRGEGKGGEGRIGKEKRERRERRERIEERKDRQTKKLRGFYFLFTTQGNSYDPNE